MLQHLDNAEVVAAVFEWLSREISIFYLLNLPIQSSCSVSYLVSFIVMFDDNKVKFMLNVIMNKNLWYEALFCGCKNVFQHFTL